ncbi:MAG: FAD-dependent oxidoreductase [Myxococcales bacterium]
MIGGGMAGLASAWQLVALGVPDVLVVEQESMLGVHASGRNAAIFLPLEESTDAVWLAARSREILDARLGTSWLSAQGVLLAAADPDGLDELRFAARRLDVFHERWGAPQLHTRLPILREGPLTQALFLPLGGVIDVHMVQTAIRRRAVARGVRIRTGTRVASIATEGKRVSGVTLTDGSVIRAERVVLAAGAFAEQLASEVGAGLDLVPLRRHLVYLEGDDLPTWKAPALWRVDSPVYFRPEAGGILASPCDETPWEPGIPETSPAALESLASKLSELAPPLAEARVRRAWACLRTMAEDREPVIGSDPRLPGLYWLAGLGGRGMTCGVAAGEMLARGLIGLPHPLARRLCVERLL